LSEQRGSGSGAFLPGGRQHPVTQLRRPFDLIRDLAGRLDGNRRLPPSHSRGIRRVHVGCGPHNIYEDWWNVDIRNFGGVDQVMDAAESWPWKDRLDYVYGEHFLEHLAPAGAIQFLAEAGKALRIGGKIRISTPALEWVIKTHFTFEPMSDRRRIEQTYATNRAFHGWGHRFLYSREFLVHLLTTLGYEQLAFCDYGSSEDPHLRNLERHGDFSIDFGYPSVWIVEARRGSSPISTSRQLLLDLREHFGKQVEAGH